MILCCRKVNYCSFSNLFKSLIVLTKIWAFFKVVYEGAFHLDSAKSNTDLYRRTSDITFTVATSDRNIRFLSFFLIRIYWIMFGACIDHYFIVIILSFQSWILLLPSHFLFYIAKLIFLLCFIFLQSIF